MPNHVLVAYTEEIPIDTRKRVDVKGQRISIFNIAGKYFAINDTCPHKGTAPLIKGTLDGIAIKCPNHGYKFDLMTGQCNIDPTFNTKVFPIKINNNEILLELP